MNLIKIGDTIINTEQLVSVLHEESAQVLILRMTEGQPITLPWNSTTEAAYQWLVDQCTVAFDGSAQPGKAPHGLSRSAWVMLLRIERHEERTELGLPIDDDDMNTTIELERKSLIRTDVHNAWLTDQGRALLAEHRADKDAEEAEPEQS